MQIEIRGNSNNRRELNILINASRSSSQAIKSALWKIGLYLAGNGSRYSGTIKQEMRKSKRGRTYIINGKTHIASRPGESPAILKGELIDSVYKKMNGSNEILIGANTPYAAILEKGGLNEQKSAHIARRNYLIRPILSSRRNIKTTLRFEIDKILK